MSDLFAQLFHRQTDIGQSRSSTLNPLQWILATLLLALVSMAAVHPPNWILVMLSVAACCILALLIFSFIYLLINDRDALRSESFTLSKIAIEKGLIGDSKTGMRIVEQVTLESSNRTEDGQEEEEVSL